MVRVYTCAAHGTGCNNRIPKLSDGDDGDMVPSIIHVPLGPEARLLDVNFSIKLHHTERGSLTFWYLDPAHGFLYTLFDNVGGSLNDGDDIDITLDDEALTNVTAGPCANPLSVCTGTYKPELTPLSVVDGINPGGDWPLFIRDDAAGETGSLEAWSITLTLRDRDNDGSPDGEDNCLTTPNANQSDPDTDGVGDVCDNCPSAPNSNQTDQDGDGKGDECDNCPAIFNADQADEDDDGRGSACDNCPAVANFAQADGDGDGFGDQCDTNPTVFNPDDQNPDGSAPPPPASCGACGAGLAMPVILGLLPFAWRRRRGQ